VKKPEQQIDRAIRHVGDRLDPLPKPVIAPEKVRLVRQIFFDGLLDAGIEKLRLRRGVEEAVKIGRIGSCPRWWCRSAGSLEVTGGSGRLCQAATAGSLTKGSSRNGAMVSRVM
jgi:hypothetical protein